MSVVTIESAAMERREAMDTRPQDRYGGRGKFNFCHWCGRPDGMQHAHRDTLAELSAAAIALTAPWYSAPGNDEYLFYACPECNRDKIVPDDWARVTLAEIQAWINHDPMAPDYEAPGQDDYSKLDWGEDPREMEPDYAALAAEPEPVLASIDSRQSAGLEG